MSRVNLVAAFVVCLVALLTAGCGQDPHTNGPIVLLTDYGETGSYVGSLKGAIYTVFPDARIDTITNKVQAFNVLEGAYILAAAASQFPPGTVFCAVVDPGVGTSRRAIAAVTKENKYFVGPDNGLLSLALQQGGVREVREITNEDLFNRSSAPTATFHGRDIFGPAAAHIASGLPMERVGPRLEDYVRLEVPEAVLLRDPETDQDHIRASIVFADTYGNLATDVEQALLERVGIRKGDMLSITVLTPTGDQEKGIRTARAAFVSTYADVPEGELLCLINSLGNLEIAVNKCSAANVLSVRSGARVRVSKAGR